MEFVLAPSGSCRVRASPKGQFPELTSTIKIIINLNSKYKNLFNYIRFLLENDLTGTTQKSTSDVVMEKEIIVDVLNTKFKGKGY